MKLFVMRHGPAVDQRGSASDFDRELTASGTSEIREAGLGLKRLGVAPATILSSPLVRARQTAELIAAILTPGRPPEIEDALAAGASPGEILKPVRKHTGDLMITGHDPDFSALVAYLLAGETNTSIDFSKGGVVALDFQVVPNRASGTLLWYLRRKQLALIGRSA